MGAPRICVQIKKNGEHCNAPAMDQSEFCFFHSPQMDHERRAARASGGAKNAAVTLSPSTEPLPISTAENVLLLIADTIHHVRTGQLDPKIANCVGYLSGIALKAIEQGKIEERLESLEAAVKNKIIKRETGLSHEEDQLFSFENGG